jgi:hypothetical protein
MLTPELMEDEVQFALDLGLVVSSSRGLEIANPIYREVILRAGGPAGDLWTRKGGGPPPRNILYSASVLRRN